MWPDFFWVLAFLAQAPFSAGLNLECKKSFGHFFGNAEQNDRGCCLSELEEKHCNQVNVNRENVKSQLLKMKMENWIAPGNSTDSNCPHTETVYSAPIFGLSAWSSEFYAIDQRDDALQIVQQSFCKEECCNDCKQVYDSVEMNVKDSTSMTVVRRKIFVAVRCDYGNGPPPNRARRSAEETTLQASTHEQEHSETVTFSSKSTQPALDLSTSTPQSATSTSVSLESPEQTSPANVDQSSSEEPINTTSEESVISTTANLDHPSSSQATTSTRAGIYQTTFETVNSTNSTLPEPTRGMPQTTESPASTTTSQASVEPLTTGPIAISVASTEPVATGSPIASGNSPSEPLTTTPTTSSNSPSEPLTTTPTTSSNSPSEPLTTTPTTISGASFETTTTPFATSSASSEPLTSTPTASRSTASEPQTSTTAITSDASPEPSTSIPNITKNGSSEPPASITSTTISDASQEPLTSIPNNSNNGTDEPLVTSTPTTAFTDQVKEDALLSTTESTVFESLTSTEDTTELTSLASEKTITTTPSRPYVSTVAGFQTPESSGNGATETILLSTEKIRAPLPEEVEQESKESINSRTPHLLTIPSSSSPMESNPVTPSTATLLDTTTPKGLTTHDGTTGIENLVHGKSSTKDHVSFIGTTPLIIGSGSHNSSQKLDHSQPIFHPTSGPTLELDLSSTTLQNKDQVTSTVASKEISKPDQETEPSVAFSIEYEEYEIDGNSSHGERRAYQNESPIQSGNYQPFQTAFPKPNIPPGYLQRPGVGIDDPVDHNTQAKETVDPESAPQYKSKRNRGIITFYRDCVGIPLHNPEDHPCVFPFIYLGKVHTACTTMEDHLPWCATEVDPNNHLVSNNWGYCTAGCPIETRTCKTVVGGPIVNVFCRFPFRYKGVQYHTCTTFDDPVGPWCATQVDAHGDYMPDYWGRCECPESLNSTISGGRRELDESVGIPLLQSEDDFPKTDGSQNDLEEVLDSQQSPQNQVYKNPFDPLPFETSTDSKGNTYIVTKQPQYLVDYWSKPDDKNPPFSYSSQRPGYIMTSRATTSRSIPQDYGSWIYPFTLPQPPTTSSQYYPPSYQRTTSSSPDISTAPGPQETSVNWAQWYGRSTTLNSYGYEMTTEKSVTSTPRSQTSTPWYLARFTTEAYPKSTRAVDYGPWFAPSKTTSATTTTTTTLSPIRLMSLRQRRPATSKDLPPQGTLATYIPSFLNDTILEEFLLKYGLNLKAFEATTLM